MDIEEIATIIVKELSSYPKLKEGKFLSQINILARYILELCKWGKKTNLVGKNSPLEIFRSLIIDSLFLVQLIEEIGVNQYQSGFLDIGAGAGIPGIPFRIFYENGPYLMVEPRKKRHVFINLMIKYLNLRYTQVYPGPIEQIKTKGFDICLSRAFCRWDKFLDVSYPLTRPNGHVIVFSNKKWDQKEPRNYRFVLEYPYGRKSQTPRYFWVFSKKAPN